MKRKLLTATAIGAVLALAVVLYQVGLETPAENALAPTAGQAPAPGAHVRLIPKAIDHDSWPCPSRRPFGPPQDEGNALKYYVFPHAEEPAKPASRSMAQRSITRAYGILPTSV